MMGCKSCETFIDPNHCFTNYVGERLIDASRYQNLVGQLIYLTLAQPNIAYAMSFVRQFMHAPNIVHLEIVCRML